MTTTAVANGLAPLGLHAGVLALEYHGWRGASSSRISTLLDRTPAHAHYDATHPSESTPATEFGSALHVAVLQPALFEEAYPPRPPGNANSNAYKEAKAELLKRQPGAILLTDDKRQRVLDTAEAVASHPVARELLEASAFMEMSGGWDDAEHGVRCKVRLDGVIPDATILDLKSTRDASRDAFERSVYEYRYYRQGAMYRRGLLAIEGIEAPHFTFIAVESEPPHQVAVYRLREDAAQLGEYQVDEGLARWAECEAKGEWPGYPAVIENAGVPEWAYRREEERTDG